MSDVDSLRRRNILFITHDYFSFTKDQIEEIAKYFDKVLVIVRYNRLTDLSGIIPASRLKDHSRGNIIDDKNVPANVRVVPCPVTYSSKGDAYKKAGKKHLAAVEKVLSQEGFDFDLIHAHFLWTSGYVGSKLKLKYNKPLIITGHGYDVYDLPFRDDEWKGAISDVLDSSDFILTVSKSNLRALEAIKPRANTLVIPNGYDETKFYPMDRDECRKKIGLPTDKRIALSVGNLLDIKGHKHLIAAMAQLEKTEKDLLCVIVGDGPKRESLEKEARQLGISDRIVFTGKRPHSEIPLWMNSCDVYVQPSLNESFGMVIVEAMACGKPVVGTRVGGIPEIIQERRNGLIVPHADPVRLSDGMQSALESDWDAAEIAERAKDYSWKKVAARICDVYSSTVK